MNKDRIDKHLERLIKVTECVCFLPIGCYALFLCLYPKENEGL